MNFSRRSSFPILAIGVTLAVFASTAPPSQATVPSQAAKAGALGPAVASVTPDGRFSVEFAAPRFAFAGEVGRPVGDIRAGAGTDRLGRYSEVTFSYTAGGRRTGSIRTYAATAAVLFSTSFQEAAANTAPFPVLSSYPNLPHTQSYDNCFAHNRFNATTGGADGPWLHFGAGGEGFLISPASHFPVARTWRTGTGALASGIDPAITQVPAGTTQQTLLVAAGGIGAAYRTWGAALTALNGKRRPANDADPGLAKLGYWTDNGGTYYYDYDRSLGYEGTLQAVQKAWQADGIPLGYLQLDSWFYPKGPNARWDEKLGTHRYEAAPELFPSGLKSFSDSIGAPLLTHARWIDPASPYRTQYAMSGDVVTDPAYWDDRMAYLARNNVGTYEQDWLCNMAQPAYNLTDRDAYLDNMARAAERNGLTMQYCMALPRDFLQAAKYSNLTTIRVSEDRFERGKWDEALYTSQLAAAVGAWPWYDVFHSSETRNVLLATLSAGMVGVGDRIGTQHRANLLKVARPDGTIVKPDVPATPTDATYTGDAAGRRPAMVATTHTDHGPLRYEYVYAYARNATDPPVDATYQAEDAVLAGPTVGTEHAGYTGRGYADFQNAAGDSVTWTVQAPAAGTYMLLLRYGNGGAYSRPLDVAVNGASAGVQPFAPTGGWTRWQSQPVVVQLRAGANTVSATSTGGNGGNLDSLGVTAGVAMPGQRTSFTPDQNGRSYVFDYFAGTGSLAPAGRPVTATVDATGSYYLVAPVNAAGIAFLGDAGKFASLGRKRISALTDDGTTVRPTIAFAPGEGAVTVRGYSEGPVSVQALSGSASGLTYDPGTRLFSVRVLPSAANSASIAIRRA